MEPRAVQVRDLNLQHCGRDLTLLDNNNQPVRGIGWLHSIQRGDEGTKLVTSYGIVQVDEEEWVECR